MGESELWKIVKSQLLIYDIPDQEDYTGQDNLDVLQNIGIFLTGILW